MTEAEALQAYRELQASLPNGRLTLSEERDLYAARKLLEDIRREG